MGALADFIANQVVYDKSNQSDGIDRSIKRYFDNLTGVQGDPDYPAGYDTADEVQSIAQHVPTVSGGTFDLDFVMANGETFTAATIAFDANAATIEGAIDTGATGNVTGWTNGDISVSGGDLNTAPVVLTFDGASVAGANHALVIVDDALLTGGGSAGAVTTTTNGQSARSAWAVMNLINLVVGSPPPQGTTSPLTVTEVGSMHLNPNANVMRALAKQAAIDDATDAVEDAILDALRANGVAV